MNDIQNYSTELTQKFNGSDDQKMWEELQEDICALNHSMIEKPQKNVSLSAPGPDKNDHL